MPRRTSGGAIGRGTARGLGVVGLGEQNSRALEGAWPRPTSELSTAPAAWTRPGDWLAMPSIASNEQKWAGLVAIYPGAVTRVAFSCQGNYTVDWGDGSAAQNLSSNSVANRVFDYASVPSGTLTSDGFRQILITVTMQGAASLTNINFAPNLTSNFHNNSFAWIDLLISAPNMTAMTLGGTIRPMTLLQRFTLLSSALTTYSQMFRGSFLSLRDVTINTTGTVTSAADMFSSCSALVSAPVLPSTGTITDYSNMFANCYALQRVPAYNTSAATVAYAMFTGCQSLEETPPFNFAAVPSGGNGLNNLFANCYNLQRVGALTVGSASSFSGMFSNCRALRSVPSFNTSSGTNFASMFVGCASLIEPPALDTTAATNLASMFSGCSSLELAPVLTTSSVTNFSNMFNNCSSLVSVPLYNMSAATNTSSMFSGCRSLQSVPALSFAGSTDVSSMFRDTGLQDVPEFTITGAVASAASMFSGCSSLRSIDFIGAATSGLVVNQTTSLRRIGNIDQTAVSAAATTWPANSTQLTSSAMFGMRYSTSYASTSLAPAEMNTVLDNLGIAATTAQTFTMPSSSYPGGELYTTNITTTSGSTTATVASATNLAIGQEVSGTGISTAVAVTFQDAGDTVTRTAHGIANDTPVSFATIVTTTGIAVYTRYYVVNAAADTFQLALTVGGGAIALTNNGSGTMLYGTTIANLVGTTVTLSIPASATGTVSGTFSPVKRSLARLKGWTVSG